MTMSLMAATVTLAYKLYAEQKYPWQKGHKLSDLWKDRKF